MLPSPVPSSPRSCSSGHPAAPCHVVGAVDSVMVGGLHASHRLFDNTWSALRLVAAVMRLWWCQPGPDFEIRPPRNHDASVCPSTMPTNAHLHKAIATRPRIGPYHAHSTQSTLYFCVPTFIMTWQQEFWSWMSPPHVDTAEDPVVGDKAPSTPKLTVPKDGKPTIVSFLRHCGCPCLSAFTRITNSY
jgi:hypothetical protein